MPDIHLSIENAVAVLTIDNSEARNGLTPAMGKKMVALCNEIDGDRGIGALAVPTIAAVRGAAVGAGINLMLATDLRIVSESARILAGFLRIGLHPGGGFFTIACRTAGREATAALGLFSQEVSGRQAEAIGMAWQAVPDDEVERRAFEVAMLAAKDPLLARRAVASFRTETAAAHMPWAAALELERGVQKMWSQHRRLATR
jgi:enoyl-CoA hydratase